MTDQVLKAKDSGGTPHDVAGQLSNGEWGIQFTGEVTNLGQVFDVNNSKVISSLEAQPGNPWIGTATRTRSAGVVGILVTVISPGVEIAGQWTFEFGEDGVNFPISITLPASDFSTIKFRPLVNAGEWFRAGFEPAVPLGSNIVVLTSQLAHQADPPFVVPVTHVFEESEAAFSQTIAFLSAFDSQGLSTSIRATDTGDLRVGQQGVYDAGNSAAGASLAAFGGIPYVSNVGGAPGPTYPDMFVGAWFPCANYAAFSIDAFASGLGFGFAEWSTDGGATVSRYETTPFAGGGAFTDPPQGATHLRILFQNFSGTSTVFKSHVLWRYAQQSLFMFPVGAPINRSFPAALVKAAITGANPDGDYTDLEVQGSHAGNSSSTPLAANEVYRGQWFPWQTSFVKLISDVASDVPGTLYIDYSQAVAPANGVDTDITGEPVVLDYDPNVIELLSRHTAVKSKWVRHRYINGPAAQSVFGLDAGFTTADPGSTVVPLLILPEDNNSAQVVRAVTAIRNGAGTGYQEIPVDLLGIPKTHITDIDDTVELEPLNSTSGAKQFSVDGSAPIRLDTNPLPGRRMIFLSNEELTNDALFGHDSNLTQSNGIDLIAQRLISMASAETIQWWVIGKTVGGSAVDQVLDGATASGTAVNANNAKTVNGVYANMTAAAQTLDLTGFTYTQTPSTTISRVRIRGVAKKQASQFQTVVEQEHVFTAGVNVGTISSPSISGGVGQTYLAAVSRYVNGTVTGVTGLGLTWTQVATGVDDQGNGAIDVWRAQGTATTGVVTANLSVLAGTCHIAVTRFTGVDTTAPILDFKAANGNNTATPATAAINVSNKGYAYNAIEEHQRTLTAGASWTEVSDQNGAAAGNDGLSIQTRAIASTGTITPTGTLNGGAHWVSIAISLSPAAAADPVVNIAYKIGIVSGITSANATINSTSNLNYEIDVTSDRAWSPSDFATIHALATAVSVGDATADFDALEVVVTESSGTVVRIGFAEYA